MKLLLIGLLALCTASVASAQNPFAKGTLNFTNRPNLVFSNYNSEVNGDPKNFDFRIDPSYFIRDGLAVGADLRMGSNSSKNTRSSFSSWQADLTLSYGRKITDRINAYVKIFAGPGHSNSEFDISSTGNNPQKLAASYFDIKGLIGLPLALSSSGAAYFTPFVSYDYYKTETASNDFKDKTLLVGFKLETYLGKGQGLNTSSRLDAAGRAYAKGSHFLEFTTIGNLSFNTRQQKQIGSTSQLAKQKTTRVDLAFGYQYYVLDNIAAGLNLSLNSYKQGYQGTQASTITTFMIQPTVTAQAPLEGSGRNLFLQLGYGFGVYKEPKKTLTDLSIRAGYNFFIGKFLAFTPKIGYEIIHGNVPEGVSGIPYVNKGLAAEFGVRTWLNFWKWK